MLLRCSKIPQGFSNILRAVKSWYKTVSDVMRWNKVA